MNVEQARDVVSDIFQSVLDQIDPERLTRDTISAADDELIVDGVRHEMRPGGRLVLLGVGKSAVSMALGAEAVLGDRIDRGLVVTKRGLASTGGALVRTEVLEASHPVPDLTSVEAGEGLLALAESLGSEDLVLCLISGGGSALVEAPVDGVTLDDLTRATSLLLQSGADIWTLNAVRRRLSRIKAGGLARAAAPARLINLVLSDVLGSPLGVIASGLSVDVAEDDHWRIDSVRASQVWDRLPATVRQQLNAAGDLLAAEHSNVLQSVVIGDAALAARVAFDEAERRGYRSYLLGSEFAGDAREFGRFWGQLARSTQAGTTSFQAPCCIIGAGEMTVNVHGDGRGGRNTEMAAAGAMEIAGVGGIAIASLATDGDDGSSGAAGGVVTDDSMRTAIDRGNQPHEAFAQNDTRAFLEACDGLIVTGQTGTNVNDLYFALIEKQNDEPS